MQLDVYDSDERSILIDTRHIPPVSNYCKTEFDAIPLYTENTKNQADAIPICVQVVDIISNENRI